MRRMKEWSGFSLAALALAAGLCLALAAPAAAQPKPMVNDAYTPIIKGYNFLQEGKFDAAEYQFKAALAKDRYNPFALNNLGVLEEKRGNLKDAMAYLTDAQAHAIEYNDKVEQTCFVGGLCSAVRPTREVGAENYIGSIVAENMKKLQEKVAKTPMAPEPSRPPKMK